MTTTAGPYSVWWDKVGFKTAGWTEEDHKKAISLCAKWND